MYKKYPNGFYVWLHRRGRITDPKVISRYMGRYVRHPAIANSRIYHFDGETVKFHCVNGEDIRIDVTMSVDQFITALIQHIPPKQFKMIRYYGAYARRSKGKYGARPRSSITQLNLYDFGLERVKYCPVCHNELQFIWYVKKPPSQTPPAKTELTYWISQSALKISQRS
jgi:phosphatidylserine decarboxylase